MDEKTVNEQVWDWTIEEMFNPLKQTLESKQLESKISEALESYMFIEARMNGDFYYKHVNTRQYLVVNNGQVVKGEIEL